ncbi:MAG TPA: class I SAM-dependent methyltransferase [Bryobacteraceae bacterium]|nr:class I SAM-dependent methyltransferase [Bryobacteraceae bacterium]
MVPKGRGDASGEVHVRETIFHDEWATSTPASEVRVRECFEALTAVENRFIFEHMGPLAGKRVLDVGSGLGESSVYLALHGAEVTMVDISPGMIEKAKEVGRAHGVRVEGMPAVGESLPVGDTEFDIVYTANTIHHVTDRRKFFSEIRRVLKPGGKFYSFDPIAYNPVINVYRRMASEVRTEDEAPLKRADLDLAREYFVDVRYRTFWLTTLLLFVKYYVLDRVHPNADRYWKRILTETPKSLWWWKPLLWVDSGLTRLPGLRWLAWNMVIIGTRPS